MMTVKKRLNLLSKELEFDENMSWTIFRSRGGGVGGLSSEKKVEMGNDLF